MKCKIKSQVDCSGSLAMPFEIIFPLLKSAVLRYYHLLIVKSYVIIFWLVLLFPMDHGSHHIVTFLAWFDKLHIELNGNEEWFVLSVFHDNPLWDWWIVCFCLRWSGFVVKQRNSIHICVTISLKRHQKKFNVKLFYLYTTSLHPEMAYPCLL